MFAAWSMDPQHVRRLAGGSLAGPKCRRAARIWYEESVCSPGERRRTLRGMTTSPVDLASPVHLRAVSAPDQPDVTPALEELYRGFEQELLVPPWTEISDLMPVHPRSQALPPLSRWDTLR